MKGDYLPPPDVRGGDAPRPSQPPDLPPRWPSGPLRSSAGSVIELLPSSDPGVQRPLRPRWALAITLFVLTLGTTTTLGAVWSLWTHPTQMADVNPWLSPNTLRTVWGDPTLLRLGLGFALPALFILLCHEMGHYLACRHYRLPATLPRFLPVPIGIGTLGAFIRIRAPIASRRQLFDVGVAGPLAGFIALLPFLLVGIALSQPVQVVIVDPTLAAAASGGGAQQIGGLMTPGHCLAIELVSRLFHGPLPAGTVLHLHPFALAAWFGLLVTAMNLLPLGQLDGGHVFYAVAGRLQHRLALPLWLALGVAGLFWPGWLLWCLIVLLMGMRHPPVGDEATPLEPRPPRARRRRPGDLRPQLHADPARPDPRRGALMAERSGDRWI